MPASVSLSLVRKYFLMLFRAINAVSGLSIGEFIPNIDKYDSYVYK